MENTRPAIDTHEMSKQVSAHGRRGGGREGRRSLRAKAVPSFPALTRNIPVYEIVPDEAIELIHEESLKILEEVGCEFRDSEAIAMWKKAGADVRETRVRIDRALLMQLVGQIPSEFTQHARNPERSVTIGGKNSVFVPMYGAPYVRDLDNQRRYGSLADLNNFHKLSYMSPTLHSRARSSASRWRFRCRSAISISSIRRSNIPTSRSWASSPPRSAQRM